MPTLSTIEAYFTKTGFYFFLLLFSSAIFLTHYFISGQAVYGDGIGYYAHLRSWVIDGDWDYTNEYKHNYSHHNNNSVQPTSSSEVQIVARRADGRAENHYSPGVAIVLLPFFLLAHLLANVLVLTGMTVSVSGYGDMYQIITGIGAVCYVVLGLWLLEKVLKSYITDDLTIRLAVVCSFFATNLLYYGAYDVINSHFASFFLVCLFYYLYFTQKMSYLKIFLLGMIGGLLTVNRLQDGVLGFIWLLLEFKNNFNQAKLLLFIRKSLIFTSGFFLALLPLLYHWSLTFESVFRHTYVRNLERDITLQSIDVLGSFFHASRGLFSVSPILLLSLIFWLSKVKNKTAQLYLLTGIFFILQAIVITIQGGWYAAAYGGRMYISTLPFFILALAELLRYLKEYKRSLMYIVPILFIILNFITMYFFVISDT